MEIKDLKKEGKKSKNEHPYYIIQERVDIITRVPLWAKNELEVGQHVYRVNKTSIRHMATDKLYRFPESYTKFAYYL